MPGWEIHSKVYRILGLDDVLCRVIDRVVDEEPPRVKDVLPYQDLEEKAPVHFGFKKNEFPLMYSYIVKNYGIHGAKCLLAHFILDRIENDLRKGMDRDNVRRDIESLFSMYMDRCRAIEESCPYYEEVFESVREKFFGKIDQVIKIVEEWLNERMLSVDVLVNASSELLSELVRRELFLKGYRGKRGYTVDINMYRRVYPAARRMLKQEIYKALMNRELTAENVLESINRINKLLSQKNVKTIADYFAVIKQETEKNHDFRKFIDIVNNIVEKLVEELSTG